MYFYLSVLPSLKHNIILLLKHSCVEFISIKLPTMSESSQKIGKTLTYPCARKRYSTNCTSIGQGFHGVYPPPPLKNEAPHLKNTPPPHH